MPDYVERELEGRGLMDSYRRRPPYQQNDYIGWITGAKQEATRQRRLEQMLEELESGHGYMKMPYEQK
ncbi:MAG: YdeI/OmpD-associated family protein [Actinobacteria bacterium]|nr:YdeI/OmpD-associated family protein [Actinomycetota bacterium]MBU1944998.1 YdeI/OmpD-associated family protein [Actinomycetota bacterium]MBU2686666.1 YdeI/OmpD-associated family protein [Actinomycetota bacterium]